MNSKRRKVFLIILAAVMTLGFQATPFWSGAGNGSCAYGLTMLVTSKVIGNATAVQGDEDVAITIEVENKEKGNFTFDGAELSLSSLNNISITGGSTGTITLTQGQKANIRFYLDVSRYATAGEGAK